jgi:hypothetical protein
VISDQTFILSPQDYVLQVESEEYVINKETEQWERKVIYRCAVDIVALKDIEDGKKFIYMIMNLFV